MVRTVWIPVLSTPGPSTPEVTEGTPPDPSEYNWNNYVNLTSAAIGIQGCTNVAFTFVFTHDVQSGAIGVSLQYS